MKKRPIVVAIFVTLPVMFVLATAIALAYGNNFSFPAARRIVISQSYSDTHQAYDYSFTTHTAVAAAKAGTVTGSRFDRADGWEWPCDGTIFARGNYIILDHGAGLTTWYFHLSNTGNTPGVGTYFYRGAPMALSDDTGCSDNPHLHFATKLNGTAFDPYAGTTDWVSGAPIPMGYRNQDGTTNGPYALDRTKIHDKWLALEGKPGSPLEDDWTYICYIQTFEQGRISDCGGASATYVEFAKTYLPDIRARYSVGSGWNSSIVVRNNSPGSAIVNITIYKSDGAVLDTRTYKALGAGAIWTLNVWDVVFDTSLGYPTGIFEGSAVVAASQDVSVVVTQRHDAPEAWAAYTGVSQPASQVHVPILHKNNYGIYSEIYIQNTGTTATNITVEYKVSPGQLGSNCQETYSNVPAQGVKQVSLSGVGCVGSPFVGSAYITNSANNPLAVASTQRKSDNSNISEASNAGGPANTVYPPLIQNNNYGWPAFPCKTPVPVRTT